MKVQLIIVTNLAKVKVRKQDGKLYQVLTDDLAKK